jgi:drug/metabolite transporter (DMT)-like permease
VVSELIIGTLLISVLHGLIPSHWIPVLALENRYKWHRPHTIKITLISAFAHALSTVLLGVLIGLLSFKLSEDHARSFRMFSSIFLVILGLVFIVRHHRHNHFHLHHEEQLKEVNQNRILLFLFISMFLSPCLEIEGYFIIAGELGLQYIILVSLIYIVISLLGTVVWISFAKKILDKVNAHKIEHNSGLISGCVLILTGILNYFLH